MRASFVAALLLSFFLSARPFAQESFPKSVSSPDQVSSSTEPATTVIRTTAGEVLLDMVVRDRHHHQVMDLSSSEVEVYEDGVRQDIKSFRLVQGTEQLQQEQSQARAAAPAAPVKKLTQLNFVSIVFGLTAPLNREFAREAVTDFLKSNFLPNTYVTLYAMRNRLYLIQPYTADKDALVAVVNKMSKSLSAGNVQSASTSIASSAIATTLSNNAAAASSSTQPPNGNPDPMFRSFSGAIATSPLWASNAAAQDASTSLGAALEAQAFLSMWQRFDSSEGMSAMDALRDLVRSQERLPGRKVVLYLGDGLSLPVGRPEVVQTLISLANRSGVTFYTVDTRGLSTESSTLPGRTSMEMTGVESRQRGGVSSQNPATGYKEMDDVELTAVSNRQQSMQELAEATGGFAVTNTNEITLPMQQVMEDIRTHYELSYAPKSTNYDGHFRKIEVKLNRPKLSVQTRKGYYALPTLNGNPLQAYEAAALQKINARPAPKDFRYDAALMKFRSNPDYVEYMFGVEIPVAALKPVAVAKADTSQVQTSIMALVRDSKGEVVANISRELERKSSQAQATAADHIFYSQPLALPRGRYTVDIAVTDEVSGKASVQRLSVPAEPANALTISSLAIVGKAEPLSGPADPQNPFQIENAQIMPELDDSVSGGPVNLYFVLYPAKRNPASNPDVTLEILKDGNAIGRQQLHVPEPRADGSIPMVVRLSPGPGSYAVIITARQGELAAQAVRSVQIE